MANIICRQIHYQNQWPKSIQKIINAGGFSNTKEGSLRAKIVPLIIYFVYYPLAAYVVYEFLFVSGCHPVISFLYAFGCSQFGFTVGFVRNRDSARERYRREVVYCLGQGQQNRTQNLWKHFFYRNPNSKMFFVTIIHSSSYGLMAIYLAIFC